MLLYNSLSTYDLKLICSYLDLISCIFFCLFCNPLFSFFFFLNDPPPPDFSPLPHPAPLPICGGVFEALFDFLDESRHPPVMPADRKARRNADAGDRQSDPAAFLEFHCQHHAQNREAQRSEEHTSELQSQSNLVCRLLLEKQKK